MLKILRLVFVHMFVVCASTTFPEQSSSIKGNKTSNAKSIHHKILTAKPVHNTIANDTDIWMDSVMLQHILQWKKSGSATRYSVYYSKEKRWILVKTCSNITSNYCDLSNVLNPLLTYNLKVDIHDQNVSYVFPKFLPEYNTKLLPPKFKSSRHDHVISLQPIVELNPDTNLPVLHDLTTLNYQVQFWPSSNVKDTALIKKKKVTTFPISDTEITINSLDSEQSYCVALRYYEDSYVRAHYISGSSEWSDPQCHNATVVVTPVDEHTSTVAIKTLVSMLGLVALILICYKGWRIYRIIKKDRTLPLHITKVLAEFEAAEQMWPEPKEPAEYPVSWDTPYFLPRHVYQNDPLPASVRVNNNQEGVSFLRGLPANDCGPTWHDREDEVIEEGSNKDTALCQHKVKRKKLKRKRDGSSGYHSASSDDEIFDVTTLTDDPRNYAQTTSKFLHLSSRSSRRGNPAKAANCKVTIVHAVPRSSQSERDYISHVPAPGYTSMDGRGMPLSETERLSVNGKMDMELLPMNGTSPYENHTYCSNLYGNIPDAFLP